MVYLALGAEKREQIEGLGLPHTAVAGTLYLPVRALTPAALEQLGCKPRFDELVFADELVRLARADSRPPETLKLLQRVRRGAPAAAKPAGLAEYRAGISLATNLLVVLFSAALLGYFFGQTVGLGREASLALSGLSGFLLVTVEACLLALREHRRACG